MAVFDELQSTIAAVAARASNTVVRIGGWRGGSGVVVAPGKVLTNAHNVRNELRVTFADGHEADAAVAGVDVDGDLAVLDVETGDVEPIEISAAAATIGTPVFAVTTNAGVARVTFGYVSSVGRAFRGPRGRRIAGSIEHTAPLAPGSSGSPLLDADGRLLALNTNRVGGGFYLALPADDSLRNRIATLESGQSVERPHLGVAIAPAWVAKRMRRAVGLAERDGVLVREIEPSSPAAKAGVREGDLIVGAAERAVAEPDDLYAALGEVRDGRLSLRLVRGADELEVDVDFSA